VKKTYNKLYRLERIAKLYFDIRGEGLLYLHFLTISVFIIIIHVSVLERRQNE